MSDLSSGAPVPHSLHPAQEGNHSVYITGLFKLEMKNGKSTT